MQFLADITGAPIERPVVTETTALGAAGLAAIGAGLVDSIDALSQRWQCRNVYTPAMKENDRFRLFANWRRAVLATQTFAQLREDEPTSNPIDLTNLTADENTTTPRN